MFIKWSTKDIKRRANLKTSLVTKVKESAIKEMPRFVEIVDEIFPKKTPVIIHHLNDHMTMYSVNGQIMLIQLGDGTIFPHLRLPIEYPGLLRSVFCFDEAVSAILRGANLMARGTFGVDETFNKGEIVQICLAEEKTPFAVGIMAMSGQQVMNKEDGAAVTVFHVLKDGLWEAKSI